MHCICFNVVWKNPWTGQHEVETGGAKLLVKSNIIAKAGKKDTLKILLIYVKPQTGLSLLKLT